MNDYISLRIDATPCSSDITDLLAAFLADEGYESFQPDADGLTAYIRASDYEPDAIDRVLADFPIPFSPQVSSTLVEGEDWNSEWEKNYFRPIVIDDLCVIHSTFHKEVPRARYDILIDPKMAFGTGHHATTSMMLRHILRTPLEGKSVIDMGTGTGILAILAMMHGASQATAIEIDPAACVNTRENLSLNNVDLTLLEGDSSRLAEVKPADFFMANINRNVILADLSRYAAALLPGGEMILSGFYQADIPMLTKAASIYGLTVAEEVTMPDPSLTEDDPAGSHGPWASLRLRKD